MPVGGEVHSLANSGKQTIMESRIPQAFGPIVDLSQQAG